MEMQRISKMGGIESDAHENIEDIKYSRGFRNFYPSLHHDRSNVQMCRSKRQLMSNMLVFSQKMKILVSIIALALVAVYVEAYSVSLPPTRAKMIRE